MTYLAYDTVRFGLVHPDCFSAECDRIMKETGQRAVGTIGLNPFENTNANRKLLRGQLCFICKQLIHSRTF